MPELFKKVYLHIGTEKTGTSTLQKFLSENEKEMYADGYYYPSTFRSGDGKHLQLSVYSQNDEKVDDLRRKAGAVKTSRVEAFRADLEGRMREEFAALEQRENLILSSEHFHSRLIEISEIQRLKNLITQFCEKVEVIVYIRPQCDLAISKYSTDIKLGQPEHDPFHDMHPDSHYFNYDKMLSKWESVFGQENIDVRIFSKSEFIDGSLIDDFCHIAGMDVQKYKKPARANQGLSNDGLKLLGKVNRYVRKHRKNHSGKDVELLALFEKVMPGRGLQVGRRKMVENMEKFQDSNELLRQRYFQDRDVLFDMDYSIYPLKADDEQLDIETACELFAKIWVELGNGK